MDLRGNDKENVWFSLVGDSAFFGKHTAERFVLFVLQDGHVMTSVQKYST